jgi:F-type H+-transporting ATPase subunit delta
MASVDDRDLALGRLYAEAMLDLAEEHGQGDALLDELKDLVAFLDQNPGLDDFLSSPLVDDQARARVIEEMFRGKASDLLVDSLQVINRKGRLAYLRAIAEAYRIAHRDLRGWVDVRVRTAVPLTEVLRNRVKDAIAASTGKKPTLIERVDPSLIGGMVIEVEGRKIDASVASRLHDLSEALMTRASGEIHRGTAYVAES